MAKVISLVLCWVTESTAKAVIISNSIKSKKIWVKVLCNEFSTNHFLFKMYYTSTDIVVLNLTGMWIFNSNYTICIKELINP